MRSTDFTSTALPEGVKTAARSVLQLKATDQIGSPAVTVGKCLILTAYHVLASLKYARPKLAIFNGNNVAATVRDVYALDVGDGSKGWYPKIQHDAHRVDRLSWPTTLDFTACRLAPNVDDACATDRHGFVQASARLHHALDPIGAGVDPNPVFMITYAQKSALKSWSSGLIHQVGTTSFVHSCYGSEPGDSGAPIFDIDGRLVGVHVANTKGGAAIACRADAIMNALQDIIAGT